MADETPWTMQSDGRIFSPISAFGHTVAAVHRLDRRLDKLEAQVIALGATPEG